jgi:hypothetical protein
MSRRPSTFRARDVRAAAVAAQQAGLRIARLEVAKDGKIVIVTGKPEEQGKDPGSNEWDDAV